MIHAFALDPRFVAECGRLAGYRYLLDKFGLGRPRVFLELPAFSKWKKRVFEAAEELGLSQNEKKRIETLFARFAEHRHRRPDATFDGLRPWLENAESEFELRPFAAIVATENPRQHEGVLLSEELDACGERWDLPVGRVVPRTPEALAEVLAPMLSCSREVHLVDPHFGPENERHRSVLAALVRAASASGWLPDLVRVHCDDKRAFNFFEATAQQMCPELLAGVTVEFVRWREKPGGEKLHNRYVLTDVGGVAFGTGLDSGADGQTDDINLLSREQYLRRWDQYASENGVFFCADRPRAVVGTRPAAAFFSRRG